MEDYKIKMEQLSTQDLLDEAEAVLVNLATLKNRRDLGDLVIEVEARFEILKEILVNR